MDNGQQTTDKEQIADEQDAATQAFLRHLHSPKVMARDLKRVSYEALEWIAMGIAVGCSVGVAMVVFQEALLRTFAFWKPYLGHSLGMILIPGLGLFLSGLVIRVLPKRIGHGTNAIIESIHKEHAIVHILVFPVKLVASVCTIGFGGSAGREGPAIQISGALASNLGRLLKFKTIPLRYVVISGISAAFGSIFKAPMAGVVFGCEILYLRNMEYRPLITCMFSSLFSYLTYTAVFRTRILFTVPRALLNYSFQASDIPYFLLFGFLVGISASLYIMVLQSIGMRFALARFPLYLKTGLGGLLTGMVGLGVSRIAGHEISILGMGIHDVIRMFSDVRMLGVYVLMVLLIGKVVATALTLGSGASGGLVMPTFFVGTALGGIVGHVFGGDALLFAIVGCLSFFASSAHAPLAMMFFAAETFNFNYILPVAISGFIGSWIAGSYSLYSAVAARAQEVGEG